MQFVLPSEAKHTTQERTTGKNKTNPKTGEMACNKVKEQIKSRGPLELDSDEDHRKYWLRTWIVAILYSLAYGQYGTCR